MARPATPSSSWATPPTRLLLSERMSPNRSVRIHADVDEPYHRAFTMSAAFPGSEVLTYNIPGVSCSLERTTELWCSWDSSLQHTSFAYPSPCVMGHTNAYFQQGVLPAPGTICDDVEIDYFPSGVQASTAAEVKEKRRVPLNPKMIWASL